MKTTIEEISQAILDLENFARSAAKITNGSIESNLAFRVRQAIRWLHIAVKSSGFKLNEEVTLLQDVDLSTSPGYKAFAHELKAGKMGVVRDIDFDTNGNVRIVFEPYNQTWIPDRTYEDGRVVAGVPVPRTESDCFLIEGHYFKEPSPGGNGGPGQVRVSQGKDAPAVWTEPK